MKLLQTLLEEQSSSKQLVRIFGKILVELNTKLENIDQSLAEIKRSNEDMAAIEKAKVISFEEGIPSGTVKLSSQKVQKTNDTTFIPSIGDSELSLQSKDAGTKKISRNLSSAARKLKEE